MAKIRKCKIKWKPSPSSIIVGYRIYWSLAGEVGYGSKYADVGDVTEVVLPNGIPSFPACSKEVQLGITSVNAAGNESDMIKMSASFDFISPNSPTEVTSDVLDEYYIINDVSDDPNESG